MPGGGIERDELPEDGARRELLEEAGLEIEGELELIGAYPMRAYCLDMLNLSYRGRVSDDVEVIVSHEHDGAQWVKPTDMRLLLDDTFIAQLSAGDERIRTLLTNIAADLDRYLARVLERQG